MSVIITVIIVVLILTAINALYVAAEFALVGARRTRLAEMAADGARFAKLILPVLENHTMLDRSIAASQIGITLSSLIAGFYGQAMLAPVLSPWLSGIGLGFSAAQGLAALIILLGITVFQVVFGELLPKSVALRYPERVALTLALPLSWSMWLLRPAIAFLNGSAFTLMRLLGIAIHNPSSHVHSPEELESLFQESARGGVIDAGEREMLLNIFTLENRVVRQIMVPRVRVTAIDVATPLEVALDTLAVTPHTRFPVFKETIDQVIGTVHLRDLYLANRDTPDADLLSVMKPVKLLPESMTVSEVWEEFKREHTSMAVIFDEYGGMAGIVTIEDILEEIFGELQDEFDREIELYREDEQGRIHLRSDMLISAANDRLLLTLPEDGPETIGGLVLDLLERTPRAGDEVVVQQVTLRVEAVKDYSITEVSLTPPSLATNNASGDSDQNGLAA
jgi:CBS domain containing-hemolysin-like protein